MKNKEKLLLDSVSRNDLSATRKLLEAGADPNVISNSADDDVREGCLIC